MPAIDIINLVSFKSNYWFDEASNSVYSVCALVLKQHQIPAADQHQLKNSSMT